MKGKIEYRDQDWTVLDTSTVNYQTSQICIARNKANQFIFVVKPPPGMRRVELIGQSMAPEITEQYFVSNNFINLKLSKGNSITVNINGQIISQMQSCQQILDGDYDLISRSFVKDIQKAMV